MGSAALGWPAGIAAVSLLAAVSAPGWAVVHVDIGNGAGPWDGESWATAYRTVQEGLNAAHDAGGGEVWVAEGTYKPTSTTDRRVSLELKPGVAIYGGFGGAETARDQRDWATHVTVLSGDIGTPGDLSDNSYHVVTGADDAVIDGFTITGGNADGKAYHGKGGGMVNYDASFRMTRLPRAPRTGGGPGVVAGSGFSPTVANCIFTGNSAREGGAVYNYDDASGTLRDCTFTANWADKGGAIVNRMASNCTVTNCTFSRNRARWRGGAVFNDYGSSATFANCRFIENSTDGNGGAMYTDDTSSQIGHTSPVVRDCTFERNTAKLRGGGIANYNKCTPTIEGCTFTGNRAGTGGGAIANDYRVTVAVTDCTFADNSAAEGEPDVDSDQSSRLASRPRRPRAPGGPAARTLPVPRLRSQQLPEAAAQPTGAVVYVSAQRAASSGDGRAWATAYGTVQEGIDAARRAGGGEVWVAAGTYRPTSTADRAVSFELKPGVALYGGFAGSETARGQRDCIGNVTVLSGDIGTPGDPGDNSYHVVKGADGAIIDGFTITGGNA
ncbi:MAG: right-handed parallel beta-helix repeat-containing protein, partial [Armatimonadota bacterium]